jgi:hypothetical protein
MFVKSGKLAAAIPTILLLASFATLISSLYSQDLTPPGSAQENTTGYGFPLAWLKKAVTIYSGSSTDYYFSWGSFLLDIVLWALILTVPIVAFFKWLKAKK